MRSAFKILLLGTGITAMAGITTQAWAPKDKGSRAPDPAYIAPAAPQAGEIAMDLNLSGYVLGIKLVSARYKATLGNGHYDVYSDMKTSGLAAILKKQKLWSYSEGRYDKTDMKPDLHIQQNLNKKSRRIEVNYDYDEEIIDQSVNPRFGSMGQPPATMEQAFASDDANTAMLKVLMAGHRLESEVCNENIPVYDGKQHYGLRMERQGYKTQKFNGEKYQAIECHVYFDPISGFDPEDLPDADEKAKPVKVYLINKPEYGIYMPVKFTYKVSGFSAVVKVKNATFVQGKSIE